MNQRTSTLTAAALLCLALACSGCGTDSGDEAGQGADPFEAPALVGSGEGTPRLDGAAVQVVPGPGLPPEISPQDANNNLDVVMHNGRVFLAVRTAPNHFASEKAELFVVSSEDEQSWRFEGSFAFDRDAREPRFLSTGGRLWLYYALLGTNPAAFEPGKAQVVEYKAPGDWTEPADFGPETYIPWRAREVRGVPHLIGYTGGDDVYQSGESSIDTRWWRSLDDGETWQPAIEGKEVVRNGGASETDVAVLSDGTVVAVGRNESGEEGKYGSIICRGDPEAPGDWTCAHDRRRYDSPLLFRHGDQVWLVGRRSLENDGHYDLQEEGLDPEDAYIKYQALWWNAPKRCSLWRVDPVALTVTFEFDLPSRGDTCFASVLRRGPNRVTLYNYSSPIDGEDVDWIEGQLGETRIYRHDVVFE